MTIRDGIVDGSGSISNNIRHMMKTEASSDYRFLDDHVQQKHAPESKCFFVVLLVGIYWLFEALPLAVTALLPIVLYPMLGILSADETCKSYMPDVNFLCFGGLVVALAVEKCNLHQRIALRVLTWVGPKPNWILLGFMCITGFLTNSENGIVINSLCMKMIIEQTVHEGRKTLPKLETRTSQEVTNLAKALLLGMCFASSLGGMATLTGTSTNLIMAGLVTNSFPLEKGQSVNYTLWMLFAVPVTVICLIMCWLVLQFYFLGIRSTIKNLTCGDSRMNSSEEKVKKIIASKYSNQPSMSYAEVSVLTLFSILVLMWMLRDLGASTFSGFGVLFKPRYFTDGTSAILVTILLFILPDQKMHIFSSSSSTLMDWKTMTAKFPWNVILLLGGGFGLAAGVRQSGLSASIGALLSLVGNIPLYALQLLCMTMAVVATNIASNIVVGSILIPVTATLAQNSHINPLALIFPTTIACSYAFMLPAGTPPNAIVLAPGIIRLKDMAGAGFFVSIVCIAFVTIHCQTLANLYIAFDTFPVWAEILNVTTVAPV
ncbi:unnamed protein product [Soboliphyme baturini]|uniref:CitMHS domain-containing protein n=1 Tax=Soboliphyme baturini TaxID=241478 RepID=A0A183IB77_9BILA|nr:unnamed protein product [Soboliphyme baturini]